MGIIGLMVLVGGLLVAIPGVLLGAIAHIWAASEADETPWLPEESSFPRSADRLSRLPEEDPSTSINSFNSFGTP